MPENFPKLIIGVGAIVILFGLIMLGLQHMGLSKLPGDIFIKRGNSSFYFPLVTSIVVSVIASIILSIFLNLRK